MLAGNIFLYKCHSFVSKFCTACLHEQINLFVLLLIDILFCLTKNQNKKNWILRKKLSLASKYFRKLCKNSRDIYHIGSSMKMSKWIDNISKEKVSKRVLLIISFTVCKNVEAGMMIVTTMIVYEFLYIYIICSDIGYIDIYIVALCASNIALQVALNTTHKYISSI